LTDDKIGGISKHSRLNNSKLNNSSPTSSHDKNNFELFGGEKSSTWLNFKNAPEVHTADNLFRFQEKSATLKHSPENHALRLHLPAVHVGCKYEQQIQYKIENNFTISNYTS
jgi:hypothetical protein